MTELPIIVATNEITVGGFVDELQLEVDSGSPGLRGSKIFSGDIAPTGLPPSHAYFGGISEFVTGDMFIVRAGSGTGDIWEYRSQPGGNDWVKIISSVVLEDTLKSIVAASTNFADFQSRIAAM